MIKQIELNKVNLTKHITLNDKRVLSYAEFGKANGYPILYCHGSQSSRLEMHYDTSFANKQGLRIITIDRPGHGLSSFNPNGSIRSFAQDVKELCHQLKIKSCSIVGMSAGAPFALGIAYSLPQLISKVAIVSGFAPYNNESKKYVSKEVRTMLNLAKSFPFLLRIMLKIQAKQLAKKPDKALKGFLKIMSAPDQEVLKNNQVMQVIENMFAEAFRNGSQGVAHEISNILVREWNFDLNEIKNPVYFYQGEKDNNVPLQWATLMSSKIEKAELTTYPAEGHLIIFNHAEEIFSSLKP